MLQGADVGRSRDFRVGAGAAATPAAAGADAARRMPQNAHMSRPELSCSVATQFLPDQSSAADDVYAFDLPR